MKKSLKILGGAVFAAVMAASPPAWAHTTALGTLNAGAPGSVTVWLGSYHTGAPNEGSFTIDGGTYAFNLLSAVLPAGLTVGSNYFFASGSSVAGEFNSLTDPRQQHSGRA